MIPLCLLLRAPRTTARNPPTTHRHRKIQHGHRQVKSKFMLDGSGLSVYILGRMAKQKLTQAKMAELRAAYESWNPHDPNSISAEELAAQFGVSKQTLYTYRDRWLEEDRRQREKLARDGDGHGAGNTAEAIIFLTTELARARARIEELEADLRDLRSPGSVR